MTTKTCRWGILGAAFIARKNWQAIRDAGNSTLVAVASRHVEKARAFITECQSSAPHPVLPDALGSYEALLERPDLDAVYIPLPTGLRKEWVLRAAAAGKHVLVEKPVGICADDVAEMIATCEKHGVQFMDGVMFMHGQRLKRLRQVVDAEVGHVRHIASQFSFRADDSFAHDNIRAHGTLEPLGCLGDLGWYCLRFSLWAMKEARPLQVTGSIHAEVKAGDEVAPVPLAFSGTLTFPGGVSASFHCSFDAANAQWAVVSGDRALLHVSDFVLPFSAAHTQFSLTRSQFVLDRCRTDVVGGHHIETLDEPSNNAPGSQEAGLFRSFSSLVLSGKTDSYWPQISLLTQQVLDACLASAHQGGVPLAFQA